MAAKMCSCWELAPGRVHALMSRAYFHQASNNPFFCPGAVVDISGSVKLSIK